MGAIWSILGLVALLVIVVCWVLTLVKIFKDGKVGLGIVGIICGLVTFIYGWMKVSEYHNRTVMMVWTISWAVLILANILGGAAMLSQFQ